MDPNLPQQPNQPARSNIKIITVIIIIIIILSTAAALIFYPNLFKKELPKEPNQVTQLIQTSTFSAQIKQALVKTSTIQGKITAIKNDLISVNTGSKIETLSLNNLIEVGEVLDPSNGTKTKKVDKDSLKIGQSVQIIKNEASNSARIILILK